MIKKIFFTAFSLAATISHAQNVGIGTTAPLTKLHVSNGSSGNGSTNSNRLITFEAGASSYIQLLNPTANETGILAGNTTSLIKSGIVFPSDSSISLRTGGNSTRLFINKLGSTGIGTGDPQTKLHVSNGTLANAQYFSTFISPVIFESSIISPSYIQLMNPASQDFRIGSGTELTSYRSGISFESDSSLGFETGGQQPRMMIDKVGEVEIPNKLGIGTTTPQTKLHVSNGTLANAQYFSTFISPVIVESSIISPSYIQLINPASQDFRIGSGTELTSYRSGISFESDSSLGFETGGQLPRMMIDKVGEVEIPNKLGIGTITPQTKLHVSNGTLANAQYFSTFISPVIFESSIISPSYIQLINPASQDFRIGSGTELTPYRSGISFESDSSLGFETGGQLQRMNIDKVGEVEIPNKLGIGTITPQTKLHVSNGTLANAQYFSNFISPVIFETSIISPSYIQLMNPASQDFRIGSGTELTSYRSGISFESDSSLGFETGGQVQRMGINKAGIVNIPNSLGIGITTPSANLDVSGTAVIGVNGTIITEVIKLTVTKDVASVSANASGLETFAVTNAQLNSTVYVSPASALADGLIIAYARVSLAGVVEVKFVNTTVAAINPASMSFFITVIR